MRNASMVGNLSCRTCTFVLIMLILSLTAYAQAPDTLWLRFYGGAGSEAGRSVQATSDCGCVIAGFTETFGAGAADVYLLRMDADGDTVWTRTYGGADYDRGFSVRQTYPDGGYVITGKTMSFGAGGNDVYLIKIDAAGDTLWTRCYGGADHDVGASIQQTHDGGYIIAGNTQSYGAGSADFYLLRTDSDGDTLWTRTYGKSGSDCAFSVVQTYDHGFMIAGYAYDTYMGYPDMYLVRTDAAGDTLWTKAYGGTTSYEWAYAVKQTYDGGYVVAGASHWGDHGGESSLLKLDENGDLEWWKYLVGPGWWDCNAAYAVEIAPDGGYILAGHSGECEFWDQDIQIIRVDSSGDTLWTKVFDSPPGPQDQAWSVCESRDGGYVVAGEISSLGHGESDVFVTRIACDVAGVEDGASARPEGIGLTVTPNPVGSRAVVTYSLPASQAVRITLYDLLGRKLRVLVDADTEAGTRMVTWDGTDRDGRKVPPGIYFCRLKTGNEVLNQKVVVVN